MEQVIYIDELIKKILKRWKIIAFIDIVFAIVMGSLVYVNLQEGKYVYKASIVVKDPDYEDMADTIRLATTVLGSNSVMETAIEEMELDITAQTANGLLTIDNQNGGRSGAIYLQVEIPKYLGEKLDLKFVEKYFEHGIASLRNDFPNCSVTVIDEPYLSSIPMDDEAYSKYVLKSVAKYGIYGIVIGTIIAVFLIAIYILWNPKEYDRK